MTRAQSDVFHARVEACKQRMHGRILALFKKHDGALAFALVNYVGVLLRVLQQRGLCTVADVHCILARTRVEGSELQDSISSQQEPIPDEVLRAECVALRARGTVAQAELFALFNELIRTNEVLVITAAFADFLQVILESVAECSPPELVTSVRQEIYDEAFLYSTRAVR